MAEVTVEMLTAAMKKAVELSVMSERASPDEYEKNWETTKQIIEAAQSVGRSILSMARSSSEGVTTVMSVEEAVTCGVSQIPESE